MDLSLLGRVIWRQKLIVVIGLMLGLVLAVFSGDRIQNGKLQQRTHTKYQASAYLLVTELPAFQTEAIWTTQTGQQLVHGLQPSQLAGAYPYMIADNDQQNAVAAALKVPRSDFTVSAFRRTVAPGVDQNATLSGDNTMPVVEVQATADSASLSQKVATTTAQIFTNTVGAQQDAAGLPPNQRVSISQLGNVTTPQQVGKSPLILQGIVFVGVFALFIAFAFARYNRKLTRISSASPDADEAEVAVATHAGSGRVISEAEPEPVSVGANAVVDVRNLD